MHTFRVITSLAALLFLGVFSATAQTPTVSLQKVNMIANYVLGASYKEFKDTPGFKYDSTRSKPDRKIIVGKFIDKNVYDQVTIQRLTFHKDRLVRVSIIMGDPNFTEEQTKNLVAKQWGDPGGKQKIDGSNIIYLWTGSTGTVMLLPADGGRQMIALADNDQSHYAE